MDYSKHKRFSLQNLSAGITPVRIRFKSTVKTSESFEIIRKAEKQLLNDRIRTISNTIKVRSWERDPCINQFANVVDQVTFKEC